MDKAIPTILIFPTLGISLYLLYINGYLMTNVKKAVMYIGSYRELSSPMGVVKP